MLAEASPSTFYSRPLSAWVGPWFDCKDSLGLLCRAVVLCAQFVSKLTKKTPLWQFSISWCIQKARARSALQPQRLSFYHSTQLSYPQGTAESWTGILLHRLLSAPLTAFLQLRSQAYRVWVWSHLKLACPIVVRLASQLVLRLVFPSI